MAKVFNIKAINSMSVKEVNHETREHTKTYTVFQRLPTLKCSISDMMAYEI